MNTLVCKTENLAEKLSFQKRAVECLQAEIFGTDKKPKSRYIREFLEDYSTFERISSHRELLDAAGCTRLIFVGDYHAVPKCQQFEARLLEALHDRPLVLALETFYGCNQRTLDDWMGDRIDDLHFLRRVRYDLEWGYDWEAYRTILDVAKRHGIPVFGVDCAPRNDLRLIHKRDAAVAAKIADLLRRYPMHTIVVCFGESHLATKHLPAKVASRLAGNPVPTLTILQNVDEIYWKATCDGFENEQVVRVRDSVYCVFNTTPFEKYEAYRRQLEIWNAQDQDEERLDFTSTVHNLINTIVSFLGVDRYSHRVIRERSLVEPLIDAYPEVYCFDELGDFATLLRGSGMADERVDDVLAHTVDYGSCYVPRVNAVYIGKFNLTHGAEEAAHFVNFALKGQRLARYRNRALSGADEFYLTVLEEALGYFGSKLIDPSRNHVVESPVLGGVDRGAAYLRRFVITHKKMEHDYGRRRRLPRVITQTLVSDVRNIGVLVHELGYLLGEQMYQGYLSGALSRREISRLFESRFEEQGPPAQAYFDLAERLEPLVPLPHTARRRAAADFSGALLPSS
jgi:hypothetical protein